MRLLVLLLVLSLCLCPSVPFQLHLYPKPSPLTPLCAPLRALPPATEGISTLRATLQTLNLRALPPLASLPTFPSHVYGLSLLLAGLGVPLSEDVLVIYAFISSGFSLKLLVTLWLGVVCSDVLTFLVGRYVKQSLSTGVEEGGKVKWLSRFLPSSPPTLPPKVERMLGKNSRWSGLIIRFCLGLRAPMMLVAGYSGRVGLTEFAMGAGAGALGSMVLQGGVAWAVIRTAAGLR